MMSGWMVFGKIIGEICFPRGPENFEMTLFDTVANSVKSHVYGPQALLIDNGTPDKDFCKSSKYVYWHEKMSHDFV